MLEYGVEDDEQFAHTSDQGHPFRFTGRQQLLVEAAVGPHGELSAGPSVRTRSTVSRRKWAAPRAVLARPWRSRAISTSPVPAAGIPRCPVSHGGAHPPWSVRRFRRRWSPGLWSAARDCSKIVVRPQRPKPGPAAPGSPDPSWRTWPHRKLRRKVPRVHGALTVQPMAPAVPPVRNTSASSRQSPPPKADATSVITLSPVLARPSASPKSR